MDKKVRRPRLTGAQSKLLSIVYHQTPKPGNDLRRKLANEFDIPIRTVQIWFQNRRAKEKRHAAQKKQPSRKEPEGAQPGSITFLNSALTSYEEYFKVFLEENY
ncbi:hypothetical protein NEMIN01_0367 [Nematocida minor]|uniref:uncharacterized protein n=1 Tax=Nematocida minor TaxID=1912983 RepID=UPI00221E82EF|nr:uncharacterized protein NEMIN01_0367 [Nematocida minor]KAI5189201.1 hypothetical protein NEMIN01_0367 [Nematocida minor]